MLGRRASYFAYFVADGKEFEPMGELQGVTAWAAPNAFRVGKPSLPWYSCVIISPQ